MEKSKFEELQPGDIVYVVFAGTYHLTEVIVKDIEKPGRQYFWRIFFETSFSGPLYIDTENLWKNVHFCFQTALFIHKEDAKSYLRTNIAREIVSIEDEIKERCKKIDELNGYMSEL